MKTACWAAPNIYASPYGTCRPYGTFETHATCWTRGICWLFKFAADFGSKYHGYCSYLYLDKLNFVCWYLKLFVELLFTFPFFLFDLTYKTRSERSCLLSTNWRLFRFLKMSTNKIRVLKMNGKLLLKTRVISCVKCEPRQGSWKCLIVGMKIASRTAVVMTI